MQAVPGREQQIHMLTVTAPLACLRAASHRVNEPVESDTASEESFAVAVEVDRIRQTAKNRLSLCHGIAGSAQHAGEFGARGDPSLCGRPGRGQVANAWGGGEGWCEAAEVRSRCIVCSNSLETARRNATAVGFPLHRHSLACSVGLRGWVWRRRAVQCCSSRCSARLSACARLRAPTTTAAWSRRGSMRSIQSLSSRRV